MLALLRACRGKSVRWLTVWHRRGAKTGHTQQSAAEAAIAVLAVGLCRTGDRMLCLMWPESRKATVCP